MSKIKYEVNIDLANETKKEMTSSLETNNQRVLNKLGAFSSLYDISNFGYKNPVLVLKTEEPGSKQILASQYGKLENVAFDMINHLINDCIVMGAKPLTVQDAIICGKLNKEDINKIVKSIAEACKKEGCVLTGGETSEQPGVIKEGTYILTSSIVGMVEKDKIIDGSKIEEGDIILALESSGIHTNGYTLVRKIMDIYPEIKEEKILGKSFLDLILEPHRCYYSVLKDLFAEDIIKGMAHITGGGIKENLNRILPDNLDAEVDLAEYKVLPVFKLLRKYGDLSDEEMLRTFNLGVGMTIVASAKDVSKIIEHVLNQKVNCYPIGKIIKGSQKVYTFNKIVW